ncbi:hypothetical protein L198_08314, partial [Cryptococcus wingfieldii CBS 7118]
IFRKVLKSITSPDFYGRWVQQPTSETPIDPRLADNPKFYPFFRECVGAIDGTHVPVTVRDISPDAWRDRNGQRSTNVMAACDFSFRFTYVRAGYEGSGNDVNVMENAIEDDFVVPHGRFYLADAGYGAHPGLRVPYRGKRYHLKEWGKAGTRPKNKEELYNLRHAQARNVIERIFGVVKERFSIMKHGSEFSMADQFRTIYAVCVLHNMITTKEGIQRLGEELFPSILNLVAGVYDENDPGHIEEEARGKEEDKLLAKELATNQKLKRGQNTVGLSRYTVRKQADKVRDELAQDMWMQYTSYNARQQLANL